MTAKEIRIRMQANMSAFFAAYTIYAVGHVTVSYDIVTSFDAQKLITDYFLRENKYNREAKKSFFYKIDFAMLEIPTLQVPSASNCKVFVDIFFNLLSGQIMTDVNEICFTQDAFDEGYYDDVKENFQVSSNDAQINERQRDAAMAKMINLQIFE